MNRWTMETGMSMYLSTECSCYRHQKSVCNSRVLCELPRPYRIGLAVPLSTGALTLSPSGTSRVEDAVSNIS